MFANAANIALSVGYITTMTIGDSDIIVGCCRTQRKQCQDPKCACLKTGANHSKLSWRSPVLHSTSSTVSRADEAIHQISEYPAPRKRGWFFPLSSGGIKTHPW